MKLNEISSDSGPRVSIIFSVTLRLESATKVTVAAVKTPFVKRSNIVKVKV